MANYTPNYQLHQWAPEDKFLRTDFNEDLNKIDAALGAVSIERIALGNYVGDGTSNRTIRLPFAPKLVIVFGHYSSNSYNNMMLTILTEQDNRYISSGGCGGGPEYNLRLKGDTLQIQHASYNNAAGKSVQYIAMR